MKKEYQATFAIGLRRRTRTTKADKRHQQREGEKGMKIATAIIERKKIRMAGKNGNK